MGSDDRFCLLKTALIGESSRLVANEQDYVDYVQTMPMLFSVYGNDRFHLQSQIQEFIGLVHEKAIETNRPHPIGSFAKDSNYYQNFWTNNYKFNSRMFG